MKNNTYIAWLVYLLLVSSFLSSCEYNEQKIRIGFSQCTGGEWREQMNQEILSEACFYDNVEVYIKNASGNIEQQIKDIQSLIAKKVDLLIISPLEDSTLIDTFNNLDFHNIPVLLIDRKISSNKYVAFVGASNWDVGVSAAKYVMELRADMPTKILQIRGYDKSTATYEREAGFVNTLRPYANFDIYTIVAGKDLDGKKVEQTTQILQDNLPRLKEADIIYAFNDAMALAAYGILKKADIQHMPIIIGIDGMLGYNKGINSVKEGIITASIVYPTGGRKAIDVGMKIINRISVPKENQLSTILIDKSNVSAYYEQGLNIIELQQKIELLQQKYQKNKENFQWIVFISWTLSIIVIILLIWHIYIYRRKQNEPETKLGMEVVEDEEGIILKNNSDTDRLFKEKIISYTDEHYMEYECDLSVLIDELSVSRIVFYKKFKQLFNDTPNNYLKKYRLEKSKELILLNQYTYAEIGYKVGFTSPAYYTKCFKDEYDQTPSQYFEKKSRKNTFKSKVVKK